MTEEIHIYPNRIGNFSFANDEIKMYIKVFYQLKLKSQLNQKMQICCEKYVHSTFLSCIVWFNYKK